MKSSAFLFAFFLFLVSCTKDAIQTREQEESLCSNTSLATVKKMVLNTDGSDYFFYLELDKSPTSQTIVFPNWLDSNLQKEGMLVKVDFKPSDKNKRFVVCLAGHNYDPSNPDEQFMSTIEVCSAAAAY